MTEILSQPLQLPCGAVLKNRIAKSAMTEGLADRHDRVTRRHVTLYQRWARGGAGLLLTGNVMVDRRFLERPGNVVVDGNGGENELAAWATAGTRDDTHLWMQISHPGRQCNRLASTRPLAPSAVRLDLSGMFGTPVAMSTVQVEDAIHRYARVATVARDCGFTGVQVHAAHGYLISQFLSPVTNHRNDDWGGTLENRARFLLRVVASVRSAVGPDFPVAVKLNSADFQKGGFTFEECRSVAQWLEQASVDLIELSGGSYEQPQLFGHQGKASSAAPPKRESTRQREAYFLQYAEQITSAINVPVMVTGGFRSANAMVEALRNEHAQIIGLARPLCVDTDAPRKLLAGATKACRRDEDRLRLPGPFGPTSKLLMLRIINIQGEVAWYYRQLVLLADGREVSLRLGLLRALLLHLWGEWRRAKRRTFRSDVDASDG